MPTVLNMAIFLALSTVSKAAAVVTLALLTTSKPRRREEGEGDFLALSKKSTMIEAVLLDVRTSSASSGGVDVCNDVKLPGPTVQGVLAGAGSSKYYVQSSPL